jgi:hypothetical protein
MTRRHFADPTTIRLTPSAAHMLGTFATVENVSRSEMLRRLLTEGMTARRSKPPPPPPPSARVESRATGRRHLVVVELDTPADRDPDATKNRIAARNAAVLTAVCECGARLEERDSQPAARQQLTASVSAAQPTTARTGRFGRIVPSVSPGRRPAGRGRSVVYLEMTHEPDCRGAMP